MYTSPNIDHKISGIIPYSQKTFSDLEANIMYTISVSRSIFFS